MSNFTQGPWIIVIVMLCYFAPVIMVVCVSGKWLSRIAWCALAMQVAGFMLALILSALRGEIVK